MLGEAREREDAGGLRLHWRRVCTRLVLLVELLGFGPDGGGRVAWSWRPNSATTSDWRLVHVTGLALGLDVFSDAALKFNASTLGGQTQVFTEALNVRIIALSQR